MDIAADLREGEMIATAPNGDFNKIINHVTGKKLQMKSKKKLKNITAVGFIVAIIVVFIMILSAGTLLPASIMERLLETTDVQYADAVESKKIIFQQALQNGEIPDNTANILKDNGVLVGYIENGEFKEGNKYNGELVLKNGDEIITAENFISRISESNADDLYSALRDATYSRTAYYYDEAANKVFSKKIGTSRNNFSSEKDFDEVMTEKMGEGSDINVNSVSVIDDGEYIEGGITASSKTGVLEFINEIIRQNPAETAEESALSTADSLKVADTIVKEQRSSLFFSLLMENIGKMKAEEGNEAKVTDVMDLLDTEEETEEVDVRATELTKVVGSAMDSPSLYAVLTGEEVDTDAVQNYSSDRILRTVENKINNQDGSTVIKHTVASTNTGLRGTIGRLIKNGIEMASSAILDTITPTVNNSLMNNSYETIRGVRAGEFLVEGAVNTGKLLAKESGATAGDAESVRQYARLNSEILAMEAKADRRKLSPFDVTSRNTFLGSILYDFAISSRLTSNNTVSQISSVISSTSRAVASIIPGAYAEGENGYMSTFGACETYGTIGAVGTAQCSEIVTFDTSTLAGIFSDPGFIKFVEENTTLTDGTRTINEDSVLAGFINNNDERMTPLGVIDGGILSSIYGWSDTIPFVSDIAELIGNFMEASEHDKRIANGAAFVNSTANPDWQTYKYAQRYVSLARATAALRQYAGNSTAYNNIQYFEGVENPVIAYLEHHHMVAEN